MIRNIGDKDHGIHRFFATRRTQTVVLHIVHGAEGCDLPIHFLRGVLWSTILPVQQKVEGYIPHILADNPVTRPNWVHVRLAGVGDK